MARVSGYHHLTLSTDSAQEDFDFYTKALGLHSVKRTVLFDGVIPVYHLYYGSPNGDASTIITTFPFRKPGVYGRRGSNQSRTIMQSIPKGGRGFLGRPVECAWHRGHQDHPFWRRPCGFRTSLRYPA